MQRGFRFFTNADSAKGRQLARAPRAALIAYWRELDRQVRVRGAVEPLSAEESDAYFASRPRDSQLGAWASPQSEPLADRAALDERLEQVREAVRRAEEIPRPEALGRLSGRPADDRVLAGPGRPPARPLPLSPRAATAGGSSGSRRERRRSLLRLIALRLGAGPVGDHLDPLER